MNKDYRSEARVFKEEARWTFWNYFFMVVLMIVAISVVGFGLKSAGIIGTTMVERAVMKQSFQYKEGMEQRGAILQSNIEEIDILLQSNPENKQELINQKSVLRSHLKAVMINQ